MYIKVLILPLVGADFYNMLEINLFLVMDFRASAFFIFAGAASDYAAELTPNQ